MKDKIYRHAPAILPLGGLILWLVTFLMGKCIYCRYQGLIWIPFLVIQAVIGTICGSLIRKLQRQANTDALTGLYNRKIFYTRLSKLRTKVPVSLILIDIDNFKSINDTYGHVAGDLVLQQFAEILQNNIRKDDIMARWGGEEFAAILPQTRAEDALKIADRIRMNVENYYFSVDNISCRITASIGIASTKEDMNTETEQFIKAADEALYKAKEKRNSVVVSSNF